MSELPEIKIDDFHYLSGNFVDGDRTYPVEDLIKAADNLPVFDLPIAAINLRHGICKENMTSFLYHYRRAEKADLSYPIIIDDTGYICDGWHRAAKAILLGHKSIKAKRLIVMPDRE